MFKYIFLYCDSISHKNHIQCNMYLPVGPIRAILRNIVHLHVNIIYNIVIFVLKLRTIINIIYRT